MKHIFADICNFLTSHLLLWYFFFQNFQVSFYLFANKLQNQKDKTNTSIFILPNKSFKVTFKTFRRSFWRYIEAVLTWKKGALKIRYILFDGISFDSLLWKFVIFRMFCTVHLRSEIGNMFFKNLLLNNVFFFFLEF